MKSSSFLIIFYLFLGHCLYAGTGQDISLNGPWQYGFNRNYKGTTQVPGIATDPSKSGTGKLWYKREIALPEGHWENAVLQLKGARFMPEVYINGDLVSRQNGGMAATFHPLPHKAVIPGHKVILEIALCPLKEVPQTDASYIPTADQWRSNCSSCLWDDVVLHLYNGVRLTSVVPFIDRSKQTVTLQCHTDKAFSGDLTATITAGNHQEILRMQGKHKGKKSEITFSYAGKLKEWTPDSPTLYGLQVSLSDKGKTIDASSQNLGIKEFSIRNKQFYLNDQPCKLRGGTIVWHRWVRDSEGRDVGFDTTWLKENIILRLKEHGANYLRFHLGVPPEQVLDLCDRYGLLVQYEWSFFHGMPASYESLMEQYPVWFDLAMRHPSIAIYHPYNETEGEQLKTAWKALDKIVQNYPPLVMAERDVTHIHKYWWSLFENLGLYYDDASQFDKAIMVDEFGGNYLDGNGNLGGYTSLKESYLRFLGRNNTAERRLHHLAQSNGKVAEYWRRINAAGVAPFAIASSWEDGNTWFMGELRENKPKSVWNALTVAWSPVAASLNLWDKTFAPGQQLSVPVHLFNDTDSTYHTEVVISIADSNQKSWFRQTIHTPVAPFSHQLVEIPVTMPNACGEYQLEALLQNPPVQVKYPVYSRWDIRVFRASVPEEVSQMKVFIPEYEKELIAFAENHQLQRTNQWEEANVVLLSRPSWKQVAAKETAIKELMQKAINRGISVLFLNIGEQYLGQGYPSHQGELGPLQGVARVTDPVITRYHLFDGISLTFTETAEPESHIQPTGKDSTLWEGMPVHYTWLWNGLRGGLIVPAADFEVNGMNPDAFLNQWQTRGADINKIKGTDYYAYELYGFYAFSNQPADKAIQAALRKKVEFLVQDAPALAGAINTSTPIRVTDLCKIYRESAQGTAQNFEALINAGKNLTRVPVIRISFGEKKGQLILSQLLTNGRLAPSFGQTGEYGIRQDESAVQMVLNMIKQVIMC